MPNTTAYITPLWDRFPSSIARQPRGCQYRTNRLRKALGEMLPTPTFWHRHYCSPTVEMSGLKNRPTGGVMYTVVYGTCLKERYPENSTWYVPSTFYIARVGGEGKVGGCN